MMQRMVYEGLVILTVLLPSAAHVLGTSPEKDMYVPLLFFMHVGLMDLYCRDYAQASTIARKLHTWRKNSLTQQISDSRFFEGWGVFSLALFFFTIKLVVAYLDHGAIPVWMCGVTIGIVTWVGLLNLVLRWGLTLER